MSAYDVRLVLEAYDSEVDLELESEIEGRHVRYVDWIPSPLLLLLPRIG